MIEDTEGVLPAYSHIILTATDGETYVKFVIQETGQTGTLHVSCNGSDGTVMVDGKNENDCFEMLPYAG